MCLLAVDADDVVHVLLLLLLLLHVLVDVVVHAPISVFIFRSSGRIRIRSSTTL